MREVTLELDASGTLQGSSNMLASAARLAHLGDASGNLGQRRIIIASQHMVVVRMGDAVDPDGDTTNLGRLVMEVIAATRG